MIVEYRDEEYDFAFEDTSVHQAVIIKRVTNLSMGEFFNGLSVTMEQDEDLYLEILSIVFWLMTGTSRSLASVDFNVVSLAKALMQASRHEGKLRVQRQRRAHDGLTDDEYWAKRAQNASALPFAEQIEIKKHYESFGKSQKWFDEWFNQDIDALRLKWLWSFGEVLGMSAHDVDILRVGDFFYYCHCLEEHRKAEERKAREANEKANAQNAR